MCPRGHAEVGKAVARLQTPLVGLLRLLLMRLDVGWNIEIHACHTAGCCQASDGWPGCQGCGRMGTAEDRGLAVFLDRRISLDRRFVLSCQLSHADLTSALRTAESLDQIPVRVT